MQFAVNTPNFGDYADARVLADLAREAEQAGWDAFFIWDHIGAGWEVPIGDPWVQLAAMAMTTERIKLGALVTPLPRRRPWKLAREAVTLDHLSNGRLILGVGIGSDSGQEFSCFGESPDDKLHGAMLDEGLDVLTGLWTGEPFSYQGTHYQIAGARFLPTPVQQPRIPIWVAGVWPHPRPFRRAARWDGVCALKVQDVPMLPEDFRAMLAYVGAHRSGDSPFAVTHGGQLYKGDRSAAADTLAAYAAAGVNWWLENFDWNNTLAETRTAIRQGPPGGA
jgi:alkanesulfonate monooxygenase SsuD/methylene tetrahydromethanopterin reductase-like flavin-dependent oxidoreductase (luciferase family)